MYSVFFCLGTGLSSFLEVVGAFSVSLLLSGIFSLLKGYQGPSVIGPPIHSGIGIVNSGIPIPSRADNNPSPIDENQSPIVSTTV